MKNRLQIQRLALNSIPSQGAGSLLVTMRVGKTKIAIDLIKRDKPKKVLWVSPSNRLIEELSDEFAKWKAKTYFNRVEAVNWSSLHKIEGHYDLIILDEEQKITENNASSLLSGKLTTTNLLSMTGTPTQDREKQQLLDKLGIKPYFVYDFEDAVEDGVVADYVLNVVKVPFKEDLLKRYNYFKRRIDSHFIGTYEIQGNKLILEAPQRLEFTLVYRENDKPGKLYAIKDKLFASQGYVVTEEDGTVVTGKISNGAGSTYQIRPDGQIYDKVDKKLYIGRHSALATSPLKTKVARELLNEWKYERVLVFSGNDTNQAEAICPNTYHSKTDSKDLQAFTAQDVNHIAMVNSGSVGFTYRNLDKLLLLQVDSDRNGTTSQKIARSTLYQGPDYVASVWILCVMGTEDEKWVENFVEDKKNVIYHDYIFKS